MKAQQIILNQYGIPNEDYENKHMVLWKITDDFPWASNIKNNALDVPAKLEKIYINREFKAKLSQVFQALECNGHYKEIKTYDGCYNRREVRGYSDDKILTLSLHSWGMAIDLNAQIEKLNQQQTHWSNVFINTMLDCGLYWGGSWLSRKDSMHWALYNG